MAEETGYEVARLEPIANFYVSPGGSSERILLYYAEVADAGAGGGVASENEDIETVAYSLIELEQAMVAGEIVDAKTIIGIQWLQKSRLGNRRRGA